MKPETRARISAAQKARGNDPGRQQQAAKMRGRWQDAAYRAPVVGELRRRGQKPASLTPEQEEIFADLVRMGEPAEAIARACRTTPHMVLRHAFTLIQRAMRKEARP
jgi:DNA-binding NarL/FixJ family response regulator